MKIVLCRNGMEVISESPQDEAYLSDTIGLKNAGDTLTVKLITWSPSSPNHKPAILIASPEQMPEKNYRYPKDTD